MPQILFANNLKQTKFIYFRNRKCCEEQIKRFKGAKYKKFPTYSEADAYLKEHSFPNKKDQYKPEDHTVPLGVKADGKQAENVNKESEDLWPQSDGDDFIADEDLVK